LPSWVERDRFRFADENYRLWKFEIIKKGRMRAALYTKMDFLSISAGDKSPYDWIEITS